MKLCICLQLFPESAVMWHLQTEHLKGELQALGSFVTTATALTAVDLRIKQEHHTLNPQTNTGMQ